jgi:hypothetical protein
MTNDDNHDNLPWFHQFTMDERVHLMGRPRAHLPAGLAERLLNPPGVEAWWWTADPENAIQMLAPQAAAKLEDQRRQLDWWWSHLSDADRAYMIENRDGELDGSYVDIVQSASETPLNEPPALRVVVAKDCNNDNRFRLPPMVRVFVELKAREATHGV